MSGPSSYASIIASSQFKAEFSILFILTDGELTDEQSVNKTREAIVNASNYPLSIIIVNLRQDLTKLVDNLDGLDGLLFDNLSLIDFKLTSASSSAAAATATTSAPSTIGSPSVHDCFSFNVLSKLPEQLKLVRQLNYI